MDLSVGLAHALVQGLVGVDGGLQVDTIQYFLFKLGMNLHRQQVEIIIFDRSTCSKRSKESLCSRRRRRRRRRRKLSFCRLLKF